MSTYQQHAAPAPVRSGGTDVAAWALVAIVVALICGGAGWAIARQDTPGSADVARNAELAAREGLMRGEAAGFGEGARLGRREVALTTRTRLAAERRQAARGGYDIGYSEGRMKAGDPNAFSTAGMGTGTFPSAGYEDVLATSLLGSEAPGFSDSAYDALGYGSATSAPYLGSTSRATSLGDDYAGFGY